MITKNALRQLEQKANSGVVQPTVCVLTGDVNLTEDLTTDLVQPEVGEPDLLNHWHTEASGPANSGDVAFVKGRSFQGLGCQHRSKLRRQGHAKGPARLLWNDAQSATRPGAIAADGASKWSRTSGVSIQRRSSARCRQEPAG